MRFRFLGKLSTCLMKGMDEREDFIVCFCLIQSRLSGPFCCAVADVDFDDFFYFIVLCLFVSEFGPGRSAHLLV